MATPNGRRTKALESEYENHAHDWRFFMLGWVSFGGPAAHLGYFRRTFVQQLGWVDEAHYSRLIALSQFLPGPSSSQVGEQVGSEVFLSVLKTYIAFWGEKVRHRAMAIFTATSTATPIISPAVRSASRPGQPSKA